MKAFLLGLGSFLASAFFLWLAIPFAIQVDPTSHSVGLFPLTVAVLPLLLGGFVAARNNARLPVVFVVGVVGSLVLLAVVEGSGEPWFVVALVLLGGAVSAAGAGTSGLFAKPQPGAAADRP